MIDVTSSRSATAELHQQRRAAVVDTSAFLGFFAAFAYAGAEFVRSLWVMLLFGSPVVAMVTFMVKLLAAGVVGGVVGRGIGEAVVLVWNRVDLHRNPRRYETPRA